MKMTLMNISKLSVVFLITCAGLANVNLLSNADFETAGSVGAADPDGWYRTNTGIVQRIKEADQPGHGNWMVVFNDNASNWHWASQTVDATGDFWYVATAEFKGVMQAGEVALIHVNWLDSAGKVISSTFSTYKSSDGDYEKWKWVKRSVMVLAPAGTVQAQVRLQFFDDGNNDSALFGDNAEFIIANESVGGKSADGAFVKGTEPSELRWWKGQLHMHTFWSDGNEFPEMAIKWYKDSGYNFLALSDHNILSQGQKWKFIEWVDAVTGGAFERYLACFGSDWVETRGGHVRIKPLNEIRHLFEEPGVFMLFQAEEITPARSHVNAINTIEVIGSELKFPKHDDEIIAEQLKTNINAVNAQAKRTGQKIVASINHPNFDWSLTAEDIAPLNNVKFMEVYNGICNDFGNEKRPSTERIWDIVLTKRLAELNLPMIYGIASDDSHIYPNNKGVPHVGRGWIVVRATHLTPEYILKAMEVGDFYASTGVMLKKSHFDGKTISLEIEPEENLTYTTYFIGTLNSYNPDSKPALDEKGKPIKTTRIYSNDIGKVLKTVKGTSASYTFKGNEIYVRAKVVSSKHKQHLGDFPKNVLAYPHELSQTEAAFLQPVRFSLKR